MDLKFLVDMSLGAAPCRSLPLYPYLDRRDNTFCTSDISLPHPWGFSVSVAGDKVVISVLQLLFPGSPSLDGRWVTALLSLWWSSVVEAIVLSPWFMYLLPMSPNSVLWSSCSAAGQSADGGTGHPAQGLLQGTESASVPLDICTMASDLLKSHGAWSQWGSDTKILWLSKI